MYPITFTKKFRNIVVLELPLSENSETLFALAYKDEVLNAFVDSIQDEFAEKKEECWKRKDNILVTDVIKGIAAATIIEDYLRLPKRTLCLGFTRRSFE